MGDSRQRRQRGATMVEYAMLVALIAMTILAAATVLGSRVNQTFCRLSALLITQSQDAGGAEGEGGGPCND